MRTGDNWAWETEQYDNVAYSGLYHKRRCRPLYWLLGILAAMGWAAAVFFILAWHRSKTASPLRSHEPPSQSWDAHFPHAAVAADSWQCSEVGRDMLSQGGNAVDSMLAALICDGLVNPHSMGLGGGFFMVVHNASTGQCNTINARETAPKTEVSNKTEAMRGWKSIGVPGEIKGYWRAHKSFGRLPWQKLFEPTIRLARDGFHVEGGLDIALHHPWMKAWIEQIKKEGSDNPFSMYLDSDIAEPYKLGQRMTNPLLAATLEKLAASSDPDRAFYRGSMARQMVDEIKAEGGHLTLEDLRSYDVKSETGYTIEIGDGLQLCTLGAPSGGPGVGMTLALLNELLAASPVTQRELEDAVHFLVEAMRTAYGHWEHMEDSDTPQLEALLRDMRDADYIAEVAKRIGPRVGTDWSKYEWRGAGGSVQEEPKGGTAHISIVDAEGSSAAATSSINFYFGAGVMSKSTGIVWNNHLYDFNFDYLKDRSAPRKPNSWRAGARPRSSMAPVVVLKDGQPLLVSGASGGSKIFGAVATVLGRVLFFNETLKEATDSARLYTKPGAKIVQAEDSFPLPLRRALEARGHVFAAWSGRSIVQSVHFLNDSLAAQSDIRKGGNPAGY